MDWLKNFFIPVIELVFIFGFVGFIAYVIFRPLYRMWNKSWKYFIKYTIFRTKINEQDVQWSMKAIENRFDEAKVKMFLLEHNQDMERAREMTWIFKKVFKEVKGGEKDKNGRKFKRTYSQIEAEKLPDFRKN